MLKTIETILLENDEQICEAICADFGNRSVQETQILEITPSLMGLRHTAKHLKKWMSVQKRHVSMVFFGGKNRVIPQSKGVVGIVTHGIIPCFWPSAP
ncbi:MAG: hypothetical protein HUN05_00710 [Desulfobacter sp.]|nr:MAG: hypothetical protein HUN05_00710 [Desulfobacter sp.]